MRCHELNGGFGLENLRLADRPDPQPGPGEVLVRVRAVALNYRDLLIVRGLYNPKLPMPRVLASDGAGEVVAVGPGVTRFRQGDRVAACFMQGWLGGELDEPASRTALGGDIDGMLAEQVVFHEQGWVKLPEHLSFEEGATLPCAAVTAWHAVVECGIDPGDTVLTQGTGGVSLFAVQFARAAGARVLITSSSDEKLKRARELGAHEGINYRTTPDWDKRVRELTNRRGVDQVVELGGANTLPQSLRAVRTGGRINLIGVLAGADGQFNPLPILMKGVRMQGIYVGSRAMFEAMNRAISLHGLRPVIDRVFDFADAPAALKHMESGAHFGKIVIRVS